MSLHRVLTGGAPTASLHAQNFHVSQMANTKSASKRARQTTARSLRNRSVLTRLRKMQKGISGTGAKLEVKDVQAMISAIDKAAKRGIIHKNAAKRRKARLNKSLAANPAGK
jgi:small subunit ribosomal protein S20